MKTTYTIKPLKWRKTESPGWGIRHQAEAVGCDCEIQVGPDGLCDGFWGDVTVYRGPSVEAAKKACERAYQRELKRALVPVKKD